MVIILAISQVCWNVLVMPDLVDELSNCVCELLAAKLGDVRGDVRGDAIRATCVVVFYLHGGKPDLFPGWTG